MTVQTTVSSRGKRKNDPERTKEDILVVAHEEFARNGLTGARVDAIAARTRTTKHMIYYYFGNKEGLFLAVLERAYSCIRAAERGLNLDELPPEAAIGALVEFTFDYEEASSDFLRLVTTENMHFGEHIRNSQVIQDLNVTVIETIRRTLARGQREGLFRSDVDPVDLHMLMTSFCFFRVANQYTLSAIFKRDMLAPEIRNRHRQMLVEAVLGYLRIPGGNGPGADLAGSRSVR